MSNYKYTENMNEISGFGGGYEEACRKMVIAGVEWLEKNTDKKPEAKENPQIFGITFDENEDMKELQDVMLEEVPDCSGAMMHACTKHVMYINGNGWDKYVEEMTKKPQS